MLWAANRERWVQDDCVALDREIKERRCAIVLRHDLRRACELRLTWTEGKQWSELCEGTDILRTHVPNWTKAEPWQTYMRLSHAGAAFRIHKSDLSVRPIWHQTPERVKAHILVCFLACWHWKLRGG